MVRVQNLNTAAPSGRLQFIGWCLDPEDLCVAKLCAHREKDLNFVRALHAAGLVSATVIADRLGQVDARHQQAAGLALRWMASLPATVRTTSPDRPAPGMGAAGPSWERVTGRIDGSAQERRTPPRLQPPPGPYLGC